MLCLEYSNNSVFPILTTRVYLNHTQDKPQFSQTQKARKMSTNQRLLKVDLTYWNRCWLTNSHHIQFFL